MHLQGKKVNFLGDSITEGAGVSDILHCRYDNRLAEKYALTVNNYGIGGTRFAHQSRPSEKPRWDLCFAGRAYNVDPSADITVVYGGVNDYLHGDAPFGEQGDTTPESFVGAVYFLMNYFKTEHPNRTVVFMTPAKCHFYGGACTEPSKYPCKRPDARPLVDYVNVVLAMGKRFGIPVVNLYDSLGIDLGDADVRARFTVDGLHLNDEGHAYLARALEEVLLGL